jgi:hypothetical protein
MANSLDPSSVPTRRPDMFPFHLSPDQIRMSNAAHDYRLFRMNALTGDIKSLEDFTAWTDDEAIARALEEVGDYRVELWRGNRKLAAISGRNGPGELTIAPAND